jgi:hypothetical protein
MEKMIKNLRKNLTKKSGKLMLYFSLFANISNAMEGGNLPVTQSLEQEALKNDMLSNMRNISDILFIRIAKIKNLNRDDFVLHVSKYYKNYVANNKAVPSAAAGQNMLQEYIKEQDISTPYKGYPLAQWLRIAYNMESKISFIKDKAEIPCWFNTAGDGGFKEATNVIDISPILEALTTKFENQDLLYKKFLDLSTEIAFTTWLKGGIWALQKLDVDAKKDMKELSLEFTKEYGLLKSISKDYEAKIDKYCDEKELGNGMKKLAKERLDGVIEKRRTILNTQVQDLKI